MSRSPIGDSSTRWLRSASPSFVPRREARGPRDRSGGRWRRRPRYSFLWRATTCHAASWHERHVATVCEPLYEIVHAFGVRCHHWRDHLTGRHHMRFQECVGISLTVVVTLALATRAEAQGKGPPTVNVQVVGTWAALPIRSQSDPGASGHRFHSSRWQAGGPGVCVANHWPRPSCTVGLIITTVAGGDIATHRLQETLTIGPTRATTRSGQVVASMQNPETDITFQVGVGGSDCDVLGGATISGVLVDVPQSRPTRSPHVVPAPLPSGREFPRRGADTTRPR